MPDDPPSISPCECHPDEYPFECPRHQCVKTAHWHMLCRERPGYFELWEQGRGPGQSIPPASGNAPPAANPGIMQRVWNLAAAAAAFVVDGCHTVSTAEYVQRLQICDGCDRRRRTKCLQCGCYLPLKAQLRAVACPLNKWPEPQQ